MRQRHFLTLGPDIAHGGAPARQVATGTVIGWTRLALHALHRAGPDGPPAVRTLALLHTCLYNAWAAYDDDARQTALGVAVRLPRAERGAAAKAGAMRHAAHRMLSARLPAHARLFDIDMRALGLDPSGPAAPFSPAAIGRAQADAMLDACPTDTLAALPADDGMAARPWYELAEYLSARDRHDDDQDVLLFLVLSNALADAGPGEAAPAPACSLLRGELLPGGADPDAAAAEALRRFTGGDRLDAALPWTAPTATTGAAGQDAGRHVGARVFEQARRYWSGNAPDRIRSAA